MSSLFVTYNNEVKDLTVDAIAKAVIIKSNNNSFGLNQVDYRHYEHLKLIVSKLRERYMTYGELTNCLKVKFGENRTAAYVGGLVCEICAYFGYDDNTNYKLEKWHLLMTKFRQFQRYESYKWLGEILPHGKSYRYTPENQNVEENLTSSTKPNVEEVSLPSFVPVINIDEEQLKVEYLEYLIKKIKSKYPKNYSDTLVMCFCTIKNFDFNIFDLTGIDLTKALTTLYADLSENDEFLIINQLTERLLN
ncbi:MAG: hypothetical protein ACRCXZ_08845 [Patescibacteria group bacterium]